MQKSSQIFLVVKNISNCMSHSHVIRDWEDSSLGASKLKCELHSPIHNNSHSTIENWKCQVSSTSIKNIEYYSKHRVSLKSKSNTQNIDINL